MRDIKSEIGKKLRRLREEKGLTREVLCNDESELTVRQLVRIEKGESFGEFDLENKIKKEMEKHIKIKWT